MATILEFPLTPIRDRTRLLRLIAPQTAEIVLFPGVRYERWDGPAPASPEAPVSRRQRKAKRKREMLEPVD